MMSEKDMVKALQGGDNAAMRFFYALYANHLSAVVSRYIANNDDRDDVLQDSFLNIIQHIDDFSFRGDGSLKAWATRIAINQSLRFLRNSNRLVTVTTDHDIGDMAEEEQPDTHDVPAEAIHRMIRNLPDGYRTVFNLYVIEGKSHHDIAQLLGIKETTSASQLHRAKALLAKAIKEYKLVKSEE